MLREKEEEVLRYKITEDYLTERINGGDKGHKGNLNAIQNTIQELEILIDFLKR